ncbi:hypothetical protein EHE21_14410 [Proteus sp. GOKU]|uniref:hypothetical protein n=1 Tax=Proteus TaxID=583 RepID=UPI001892C256|nr:MULTISPECIES: hypothetical protein [Proteus]QPB80500.1 hypothetical protein EHE21_14410 [Proteus sp. GOKU]QQP26507.1 hypothetical protein D7029_14410 [Proteus vulgaris]
MPNKNELSVAISEIYNYKLKMLFNPRTLPMDECDFIYSNWDDDYEKLLSLRNDDDSLYLSWWCDLFDFEKAKKEIYQGGYKNHDIFFSFLRIIPSIFLINSNAYYENKNIFVTYFVNQLKSNLSATGVLDEDESKSDFFNYLIYELGIGDRFSKYFIVREETLLFNIESDKFTDVKELIKTVHIVASKFSRDSNKEKLDTIKQFQLATIDFLLDTKCEYKLPYDDVYIDYSHPNLFVNQYHSDKKKIFSALIDCLNENQSKCNLFISNIIYMNYIYYVIRKCPAEVLDLKKYCGKNNKLFLKIISKIINRNFYIRSGDFKGLNLGYYLSKI